MKRTSGRDLVALVLAGGTAIALVVIALGAAVHHGPISQAESSLLSTALGAGIGAIAAYLGLGRDPAPAPAEPLDPTDLEPVETVTTPS